MSNKYVIYFSSGALAPAFEEYRNVSDGSVASPVPAISNLAVGSKLYTFTATPTERIACIVSGDNGNNFNPVIFEINQNDFDAPVIAASGIIQTNLDVAVSSRSAVDADNSSIATIYDTVILADKFMSGDYILDTSVSPWEEVAYLSGTDTTLFRRKLYKIDGDPVTAITDIIGRKSGS